jgi:hypothetical protein
MAFDQSTRNRLQRFVTDVRRILEEEFTRQLQNDLGMDPVSGDVTSIENLTHINDSQRETARIMRDTLAHYCASPGTDVRSALDRIVREQAFTVLNRLAALRMAEARDLLIESVGNGYQAKGFQLYARLAGAGLGETGDAYRAYLKSVFDELSEDLPGLFDRYSPQGRLFPRESALMQVLAQINHGEIEPFWAEDETIGWIYQYFNSKEERKAMRDASQAPRNSRELAVRNQFFTPRYVVEFLVDNTLGRLWFNWTGGETALRDRCQYLLVKPDERPEAAPLLRDPRTIKLLDPACGSMHFGLYAFDLFQAIYREAWDWEQAHGSNALDRETGGSPDLKPLSETYADQDAFLRDVPRLIIEHNIYGVDIDPRAAQIASLALWLRAQRAWHEAEVKAKERPQVGQGHVVAAVAPPAEVDLRNQFKELLDPLDAELLEQTLFMLKGLPELGVLLRVEKDLPALIRKVFGEHGPMFSKEDMAQWQKAEARLRDALMDYARAAQSTYQGRLFAEDALQGLRMIDLCRESFDVVVMNPPYGDASQNARAYLQMVYSGQPNDLFGCFLERALEMGGMIGSLTSRTFLFFSSFEKLRTDHLFVKKRIGEIADLGFGVLDDAMVETCAMTLRPDADPNTIGTFFRLNAEQNKTEALRSEIGLRRVGQFSERTFEVDQGVFVAIEGAPMPYWLGQEILYHLKSTEQVYPEFADIRLGAVTSGNDQYLRLRWEVKPERIDADKKWAPYAKGGDYSKYYGDIHLLIDWRGGGRHILLSGGSAVRLREIDQYLRPGLTYPLVTVKGMNVRVLPEGCVFDNGSPAIFTPSTDQTLAMLAFMNSKAAELYVKCFTSSRHWQVGYVRKIPFPNAQLSNHTAELSALALRAVNLVRTVYRGVEPRVEFTMPLALHGFQSSDSVKSLTSKAQRILENTRIELANISDRINEIVYDCFEFDGRIRELIEAEIPDIEPHRDQFSDIDVSERGVASDIVDWLFGCANGHWKFEVISSSKSDALEDPFLAIPTTPPGSLTYDSSNVVHRSQVDDERRQDFQKRKGRAILVDDPGHPLDVAGLVSSMIEKLWNDGNASGAEEELSRNLRMNSIREYYAKPAEFFASHMRKYSQSRRLAPIYWPLSTNSGSYTLWLYYPELTSQTLYSAVNDFVEPKLMQISREANALRTKGSARSRDDEKAFESLQALELELIELRDTLLRIAPTYRPNHDDGVQITAAPLWQLFRHKPWQKILKDTWAKLEKGDYDWSHLAMAYWPDRVREKCKTDKSLAIAHDLEHLYVEPEPKPSKAGGRRKRSEA